MGVSQSGMTVQVASGEQSEEGFPTPRSVSVQDWPVGGEESPGNCHRDKKKTEPHTPLSRTINNPQDY